MQAVVDATLHSVGCEASAHHRRTTCFKYVNVQHASTDGYVVEAALHLPSRRGPQASDGVACIHTPAVAATTANVEMLLLVSLPQPHLRPWCWAHDVSLHGHVRALRSLNTSPHTKPLQSCCAVAVRTTPRRLSRKALFVVDGSTAKPASFQV